MNNTIPFKRDAEFAQHNTHANDAFFKELRELVQRVESLTLDRNDISRDISDVFTVAKSKGFDTRALRRVLADRKRNAGELEEEAKIVALYKGVLI